MDVQSAEPEKKRQCHFFVTKRKRYCRLLPAKGNRFCGEHLTQENTSIGHSAKEPQTGPVRIPCPYDAHHTVAVKQLDKHLKVCNSRPKEQPVFYEKGINAGSADKHEELEAIHLASFSLEEIKAIIGKVETIFSERVPDLQTLVLDHEVLRPELDSPNNGPSARKHLVQLASLLGHLSKLALLQPSTCFVEFGAGRGRLSQWIQQAVGDVSETSFLLVDRAAVRHKRDALYQQQAGGPVYERINMDIENLSLGRVPSVCDHPSRPIVAYTKHLCGGATDLALRCLMETRKMCSHPGHSNHGDSNTDGGGKQDKECTQDLAKQGNGLHKDGAEQDNGLPGEVSNTVKGIVMALCCHHRCSWKAYVGKPFLRDTGITEREFMALVRMSSWAVCGIRVTKDDGDNNAKRKARDDEGKSKLGEGEAGDQKSKHFKQDTRDEKQETIQGEGEAIIPLGDDNAKGDVGNGDQELKQRDAIGGDLGLEQERRESVPSGPGQEGTDGDGGSVGPSSTDEGRTKKDLIEQSEIGGEDEMKDAAGLGGKEQLGKGGKADGVMPEKESIVSSLGLSVPQREDIGFKCKRVLDYGRVVYLQSLGLNAKLLHYVERDISPENAVILATPISHQ